jgi:Ca2+-binding RTX toxin-like protein
MEMIKPFRRLEMQHLEARELMANAIFAHIDIQNIPNAPLKLHSAIEAAYTAKENGKATNITFERGPGPGTDYPDLLRVYGTEQADVVVIEDFGPGRVHISLTSKTSSGKFVRQTYIHSLDSETEVVVHGLGGDDTIVNRSSLKMHALGGDGNDHIEAGNNSDALSGGNGDDRLIGGISNDHLDGGNGNDVLIGGRGNDVLISGTGFNELYGDADRDTLDSTQSYGDTAYGGDGDDTLLGGSQHDKLYGEDGVDTIRGGRGNDQIFGGSGTDFLYGDGENDQIFGGSENDLIWGGDGHDDLFGEDGFDQLFGQSGSDLLDGGQDGFEDFLVGGTGVDFFFGDHVIKGKWHAAPWEQYWKHSFYTTEAILDASDEDKRGGYLQEFSHVKGFSLTYADHVERARQRVRSSP